MYSYGSSARAGVGKRGHGGRPYRPPRKRRDPNSTPPPLKECCCLVEIHLPEYRSPEPLGRTHQSFGGRQAMEQCERNLRSEYQVHLMVPGKKQQGPVTMVSKSYREALPALACLFQEHLIVEGPPVVGRIHRNVKDPRVEIVEGSFLPTDGPSEEDSSLFLPYWLFQSPNWSVLACSLLPPPSSDLDNTSEASSMLINGRAQALQTCLDNVVFRLGKEAIGQLDIFMDPYLENSFAAGNPNQADALRRDIVTAFQQQQQQQQQQSSDDDQIVDATKNEGATK